MALNIDAKLEGEPTFSFTNDMRNLENFHLRSESLQTGTLWDFFI